LGVNGIEPLTLCL